MSTTQKDLDISRYVGLWYEVSKIPFHWEKNCNFATAEYSWNPVKNILNIKNNCLDGNHKLIYSRSGEAKIVNINDPSKLKVVFNDGLPADKSTAEWNYGVIYTDYDNYSIVTGSPNTNQMWILSRKPQFSAKDALMLLNKIKSFGYSTNQLVSKPSLLYK